MWLFPSFIKISDSRTILKTNFWFYLWKGFLIRLIKVGKPILTARWHINRKASWVLTFNTLCFLTPYTLCPAAPKFCYPVLAFGGCMLELWAKINSHFFSCFQHMFDHSNKKTSTEVRDNVKWEQEHRSWLVV